MTTEKILKPRNLEVTGLIYSHKEFLADAMGLRDYERRKTQSAPASFSRESNCQDNDNNDDILAIKNTYDCQMARMMRKTQCGILARTTTKKTRIRMVLEMTKRATVKKRKCYLKGYKTRKMKTKCM